MPMDLGSQPEICLGLVGYSPLCPSDQNELLGWVKASLESTMDVDQPPASSN